MAKKAYFLGRKNTQNFARGLNTGAPCPPSTMKWNIMRCTIRKYLSVQEELKRTIAKL